MSANNKSNYTPKPPAIPKAGSRIEREDCLRGLGLNGWKSGETPVPGSLSDDYTAQLHSGDADEY